MKEYIERALAVQELEVLRQEYEMHDDCDELVARRCREAISALPAADVVEVRHAHWNMVQNGKGICGACNRLDSIDQLATHCRYCGARMDKED